ncbi:hypothetical protein G7046_g9613 [Stylonectria norvegica]|nr:hypothetical protein G7046_g9613 [Stylonectria norvegica]
MAPTLALPEPLGLQNEGPTPNQTQSSGTVLDWPRSALLPDDEYQLQQLTSALEDCPGDGDSLQVCAKLCVNRQADKGHRLLVVLSHQLMQQRCLPYRDLVERLSAQHDLAKGKKRLLEEHVPETPAESQWKSFITDAIAATESWGKCRIPLMAVGEIWGQEQLHYYHWTS